MSVYQHPYKDVDFVIRQLLEFDGFCEENGLDEINADFAGVVLGEAQKFAAKYLVEQNQQGDLQPAKLVDGKVIETPGFADSYQAFVEQGWPSLSASEDFGGQGLPNLLSVAANEIWQSSNLAFALCPLLGQGAISAIEKHGSETLKAQYLEKMISGQWTGTMNLTEASAGTDLAAIKTRAVLEDGQYKIFGQKIFITWGDHQMAENIVHLVLARLPDAPAGVKGISLFIVPKFLLDEEGNPSTENDLRCLSLEHKMGIHGSPTCVMSYGDNDGAIGYLVGEQHCGLRYMFSMMNHARQGVGVQGLGISERAFQGALEYASQRVQGTDKAGNNIRIIQFGDVRRMLLMMKSGTEAMRALCYLAGFEYDKKAQAAADDDKNVVEAKVAFLTPIVKGWCTELAQELVSLAMQVYGGAGYIEEAGVAQHVRDARILPIYEGTTGIQALDLTIRKTLLDNAAQATLFIEQIQQCVDDLDTVDGAGDLQSALASALDDGRAALTWLAENPKQADSVAAHNLALWGYLLGGWLMARSSMAAQQQLDKGEGDSEYLKAKLVTCQFYTEHLLVRTKASIASIKAGSETIVALSEEQFFSHVN